MVYAKDRTTVIGCRVPFVAKKQALTNLYSINAANCGIYADYAFRVDMAINLANAYRRIHQHGCVVGDGSPKNTLQGKDASVCLIDIDSIQITRDGVTHRCNVCTPEYTPPEFQGVTDLSAIDRGADYDAFALAAMIFEILVGPGYHPFASRYAGTGNALPIPQLIRQGTWPHAVRRHPDVCAANGPAIDLLHPLLSPAHDSLFPSGPH